MSYRSIIEESNYYSDPRVANARNMATFRQSCDMRSMTFSFQIEDGEGESKILTLPLRREVCPTCDGVGTHVNPSIDAGGISSSDDDFWQDDEVWGEDEDGEMGPTSLYHSGAYDVTCQTCEGKNVVPAIDREFANPTTLALWDEIEDDREALERMYAAERRMGA